MGMDIHVAPATQVRHQPRYLSVSALSIVAGVVIAIADGDTLTVLTADHQQIKVRLSEIDAPERKQPFGTKSRQELADLCHEKPATVQVVTTDRYKRTVGRVVCAGVDANSEQVRTGMAWVYDRYAKDKSLYRLQDEARASGMGLWSAPDPIPPWEWRRK